MQEGVSLALATDFFPACWVDSMQLVVAFACLLYRFKPEEALSVGTVGRAQALGIEDRGSIEAGKLTDHHIWDVHGFENVIHWISGYSVQSVIKRGQVYDFITSHLHSSDR